MKILLVNAFYPPYIMGGAEQSVQLLAEALVADGNTVTVLTSSEADSEGIANGVRIVRLRLCNPFWGFRFEGKTKLVKFIWHFLDMCNFLNDGRVAQVIRKEKPDVVHTNTLQGFSVSIWRVCHQLRIPLVHTLRDYYLICRKCTMYHGGHKNEPLDCKLWSIPKHYMSRYVAGVVGVSGFIVDKHIQKGYFKNAVVKTHIYNIKPTVHHVDKIRKQNRMVFGYAGVLAPYKGLEIVLEAFRRLPSDSNSELRVYGKAQKEKYLSRLISVFNSDRILFCGFQPVAEVYRYVDFILIPSLWEEPFPRTLIESYSQGIPVIASNKGGIPEMVDDGRTGFLYEAESVDLLADRMLKASKCSFEQRELMRQNCLAKSAEFSAERIVDQYMSIYKAVARSALPACG